jgi:hypothetical protein
VDIARSTNSRPSSFLTQSAPSLIYNSSDVYDLIEKLKSQNITSTKYDSVNIYQPVSPPVIVFSNILPDIHKLSLDRWIILVNGILPDTIDYCFVGSLGKLFIDNIFEHIKQFNEINPSAPIINPVRTIIDIEDFPASNPDVLTVDYRTKCWDRGQYPTYQQLNVATAIPPELEKYLAASKLIPNGYLEIPYPTLKSVAYAEAQTKSVHVIESPLSDDDIQTYNTWKQQGSKFQSLTTDKLISDLKQQSNKMLESLRASLKPPDPQPDPIQSE